MDPIPVQAKLAFSVAAGILFAVLTIHMVRLGLNIYRNNDGWRSMFGAAIFCCGLILGWMFIILGVNP